MRVLLHIWLVSGDAALLLTVLYANVMTLVLVPTLCWRAKQMQAKIQARVNDGTGRFPQIPAEIHRRAILLPVERKSDGRMFDLKDIIGFYARYPENGKRIIKPLGKDPVAAYTQFVQIEQDFSRVRKGLLPLKPARAEAHAERGSRYSSPRCRVQSQSSDLWQKERHDYPIQCYR